MRENDIYEVSNKQNVMEISMNNVLCEKVSRHCYYTSLLESIYLLTAVFCQIHSIISYGMICWSSSTDIQRIFVLQKCAIRILSSILKTTRTLFRQRRIMTAASIYIYQVLVYIHKNRNLKC